MGWSQAHRINKIWKVPSEGQGALAQHWAPQPRALGPGRGSHTTQGCEKQQGLCLNETQGCWNFRCSSEGPLIHLLAYKLCHPRLQCRRESLTSVRGIWGGTELTSFRVGVWGAWFKAALSTDGGIGGPHGSFFELLSSNPAIRHRWSPNLRTLSINLVNIVCTSCPGDSPRYPPAPAETPGPLQTVCLCSSGRLSKNLSKIYKPQWLASACTVCITCEVASSSTQMAADLNLHGNWPPQTCCCKFSQCWLGM